MDRSGVLSRMCRQHLERRVPGQAARGGERGIRAKVEGCGKG